MGSRRNPYLLVTLGDVAKVRGAGVRVMALLREEEVRLSNKAAVPAQQPAQVAGRIEYRDVRFRHAGRSAWTLDGVSFEVAAGSTVALVGASGSGAPVYQFLNSQAYLDSSFCFCISRENCHPPRCA